MAKLSAIVWEVGLAVVFGAIILFLVGRLGTSAGSGTPAENWSTLASTQFTDNVSLIGLVLVIGLIAAVIGTTKMFKR